MPGLVKEDFEWGSSESSSTTARKTVFECFCIVLHCFPFASSIRVVAFISGCKPCLAKLSQLKVGPQKDSNVLFCISVSCCFCPRGHSHPHLESSLPGLLSPCHSSCPGSGSCAIRSAPGIQYHKLIVQTESRAQKEVARRSSLSMHKKCRGSYSSITCLATFATRQCITFYI